MPGKYGQARIDTALFDMPSDPYETTNVISEYPDVANELKELANTHKVEFYGEEWVFFQANRISVFQPSR